MKTIKWHRTRMQVDGVPLLVYTTDDKDWRAWSIDRIPTSNGSRTDWYEYQPKYHGEARGKRYTRLQDAQAFIERQS